MDKEVIISNYEKNAEIIGIVCTEEEIISYFQDMNDQEHVINVIIHRVAKTLYDNPTLTFGSYESADIFQFCWQWCIETLVLVPCKKTGIMKRRYNCKTSLFGYLHKVCLNRIFKLKRDKQWRGDIADQNACKKCKLRDKCNRKIKYSDIDSGPKCKVMEAALKRNHAKHALSIQADYDITEPQCHRNTHEEIEISDIIDFYGESIPDKYRDIFYKLINNQPLTGISKNSIIAAKRWCWRILKGLDEEQYEYYKRIYYNSYQRDLMRKIRKKKKKQDQEEHK